MNELHSFNLSRSVLDSIKMHDDLIASTLLDKSKRQRPTESFFTSSFADTPRDIDSLQEKKKTSLLELFCASGVAKVPAFLEHLGQFLDDDTSGKVLVFAHHRLVLDEIDNYLSNRGIDHIRIDGQTLSRERYSRVNRFQESPLCRVAVLAITAAGVAITLTSASTVFFAELFCNASRHFFLPSHCCRDTWGSATS